MAPAAAAPAPAATACSSSASSARPPSTASSSQSPPRRTVPALLLFISLAALLILSSGEAHDPDADSGRPLKDVSLEYPEVTFAPSSMGGIFCERIRISKIPRWQFQSYANQIHIRMNVSHSLPEKFHWKIQICFHGNVSTGLCQCEMGEWQALQGGTWNAVKSPYNSRYVDVKLTDKKSAVFSLSIQEELQKWRLACLGIGFVLLFLSPIVSKWAPFYYSSSMALGILLVVLIVLFQGMKLLPMGKKGLFYLTIYGSVLGVGSYAAHYFSSVVASILENFGLSEEMHNPVSIFLLVAVVLTGAGFGYWMVRRYIISKDGCVDAGIAQFVKWAMRVVGMFFVMQSTLDPILAFAALAATSWVCSVLTTKKVHKPTAPKRKQSNVSSHPRFTQVSPNTRQVQFLSPSSRAGTGRATTTQYGWNYLANGGLASSALVKRLAPNQDEDYYSTFHNIEPRKYSKREWEEFTEESTRNALMEHTATPEFAQWAADNAHRLRVERDDSSEDESIETSSGSSEEAEKGGKASSLLGRFM
ncbi:uncharacterized protein LOC123446904 [Hordeum vulgare subsp. vulgare]|uniref:Predicted protein n=2 Tax=Hordeum vulgare subsp. vulgare TaxID=112509 RepID=F2DJG5_HORVV|nr:uncharacterized protein LOC123446904 [Hordeum vulgare subsp. vulgare]KAI4998775.1 hypothetical protein ZWY2020_054117 [Hordeum vulgare]BAJ95236.1 predicted protein [Hordeum vulgare subsp. vulgare]BAK06487.1 predicted protein [Hordeum vulgare subsp. vulgare]